jgi:hypothetical protein
MQGALGIGTVAPVATGLFVANNITGATTGQSIRVAGQLIQSDVTSSARGVVSLLGTANATFTLTNIQHFFAGQGTLGTGSTVTNQFGFQVASSLTGATNNYGFYSDIASGTGRYNFYANGTAANVFVGTTSLGGTVGSESLRVTPVASAVNYWDFYGGATGVDPYLYPSGSDTNRGFKYLTKGTGAHTFQTNTSLTNTQFVIANTTSAVNYITVFGNTAGSGGYFQATGSDTNISILYSAKGTGSHTYYTGGNSFTRQFDVVHSASAVNYLQVTGSATGASPVFSAQGSDANVGMILTSKGTYGLGLYTNGGAQPQFSVAHTASAVNYHQITGSATGTAIVHSAQGSDTNIDLALTPKGTGVLSFGTYTAGIIAQAGYITIKDAGGTTRRLLVG